MNWLRAASPLPSGIAAAFVSALAAGCATPRDAVANLTEIYAPKPAPPSSHPAKPDAKPDATTDSDRATYAADVADRGFFARLGRLWHWPWDAPPPFVEREPLDDPVEFALDNLFVLDDGGRPDDGSGVPGRAVEELDPCERVVAIVVLSEIAALDRSRIVRQRAFEVLHAQFSALGAIQRVHGASPVDEEALLREIEPLIALCEAPEEGVPEFARSRVAEMGPAASALAACVPDRLALAKKLALLSAKAFRRAESSALAEATCAVLEQAAIGHGQQVAHLLAHADPSLPRGVLDPADGVRAAAGRLLLATDPIGGTMDLGRTWVLELNRAIAPGIVTLVRIDWLRALADAPIVGANVHPTLRSHLAQELLAEDASVAWWAREALAHLLARDPASTPLVELKAAWLALGEWQPARVGA